MRAVRLLLAAFAARWKNRRNIGVIIVLIIVMISTFCYVRKQEPEEKKFGKITLGVAKEDTSEYANLLMTYFNENEDFLSYVELLEGTAPVLQKELESRKLDAYLVIPENFAQSMIQMENLPIKARISMENPTKALILRHAMEAYKAYIEAVEVNCTALYRRMREENFTQKELDAANFEISMDLIFTALGKDAFFKRQTVEQEVKETLSLTEHYQYTLVYFVLLFSFIPAGLQVISMKKNGLKDRLRVVNVSTASMFAAIGIPYLVAAAAVVGAVSVVKGSPERMFPALLFVLPWILVFLLSGFLCKDSMRYLFVCSMLLVCLAVLGGSLVPEAYLPEELRQLAQWMPNRNFTYVMGGVWQ